MNPVPAPPESVRSVWTRRVATVLCWLALGGAAVAAQRWVLPWSREGPRDPGPARWLWASSAQHPELRPSAFFLVRELELKSPPASARLAMLGDEEYSAFLNGTWIGAGRYLAGGEMDVWEVGGLLRTGRNRIVVELRSGLGIGGFLARLTAADGGLILATDAEWRVIRADAPDLRGEGAIPPGERPMDFGTSPAGRWRTPGMGPVRSPLGVVDFPEWRALRCRPFGGGDWEPLSAAPRGSLPLGKAVICDWGEAVGGYLALEFAGREPQPGLVAFADESPTTARPIADALVVRIDGLSYWLDSQPRRFRYVTVLSLDDLVDAKVYTVDGAKSAAELRQVGRRGVLGIDPPPLRAPVEDEIWRELERFASQPLGEGR